MKQNAASKPDSSLVRVLPIVLLALASPAWPQCAGDCNDDGHVSVDELVIGSQIALGRAELSMCPDLDADDTGSVEIDELVDAVAKATGGCPATPTADPTVTPTPAPTSTPTNSPTSTPTGTTTPSPSITPTPSATPTASTTATTLPTDTFTPTFTGTSTRTPTPTVTSTSTPTSTPTETPVPTEPVDTVPRGGFRQVQVSTQGATRLTLLSLDWLRLWDQAGELALPEGDPAGPCAAAVTTSCEVSGGESTQLVEYSECRAQTASGHQVERSGRVVLKVSNDEFCTGGGVGPNDDVTLELIGYQQSERTAGGDPLARVSADLRLVRHGLGAGGCLGPDVEERSTGTVHLQCLPEAESIDCPERGADVGLDARGLERVVRSTGALCRRTTSVTGQWAVTNSATGESFPQSFDGFSVVEQDAPGGSSTAVTVSGNFAANCLGSVRIQPSTLIETAGDACPSSGRIDLVRPGSEPEGSANQAGLGNRTHVGNGPAPGPTPDGEGFEQRLLRAANGQVYQVLQFEAGPGENGAEAVQVTTLVGSLGGSVPGCFNTVGDEIPTAVTGVQPGRAFDAQAVFKSPVLAHVDQLCFNPNAMDGNGALCVGLECAVDCRCTAGASCATFTLGEEGTERTPITVTGGGIGAAQIVSLEAPFSPCGDFAGREAYAFGGTPTTEQALCGNAPSDGFMLPHGSTVVFAYETQALELFNAGAAGLLIDEGGTGGAGCESFPAVLSPGQVVINTAFAPRAEFDDGNLLFRYDDDPADDAAAPDASVDGCEISVLIQCGQDATPTPTAGAERPCGATVLDSISETSVEGSMMGRVSDETGWCGLPTGNRDAVHEFTAPQAGAYIVELRDATFDAVLFARNDECGGAAIPDACANNRKGQDDRVRDRDLELELDEDERVAIVVDGGGKDSDRFRLRVKLRQPDLIVQSVGATPSSAAAGAAVEVSATILNQGDGNAGPFAVDFSLANDGAGTSPISLGSLRCPVSEGLAPKQTIVCTAPNDFTLPLVAPGSYFLVARADGRDEVLEAEKENNSGSVPFELGPAAGATLDQRVFRAGNGTVYQLIQAIPQLVAGKSSAYRVTSLAASLGAVTTCETAGTTSGATALAAAGTDAPIPITAIRRTQILRPNSFGEPLFEGQNGGTLTIGAADGFLRVCSSETCDGAALSSAAEGDERIPAACSTTVQSGAACTGRATVAFERADGQCGGGFLTTSTQICNAAPLDGFVLRPGEAVVFVSEPGREPFEVGIGAFGTAGDGEGRLCPGVVETRSLENEIPRAPILSFVSLERGAESQFVALSPNGAHVYLTGAGFVKTFRRSAETGLLELIQELRDGTDGVRGLDDPVLIEASGDGRNVYIAGSGGVVLFARDETVGTLSIVEVGHGIVDESENFDIPPIAFTADGLHGYALREGKVSVYSRDGLSGVLRLLEEVAGIDSARSVAVSADGKNVYAEVDNAIRTYARNSVSGSLTFLELDPVSSSGDSKIFPTADGRHVYVLANSLAVFARDEATGRLSFVENVEIGGSFPSTAVVSPDGEHFYAGGQTLDWFTRDAVSGGLTFAESIGELFPGSFADVQSMRFDPAGQHLYVTASGDQGLEIYRRETSTGELTLLDSRLEATGQLSATTRAAVSPDGKNVYSTSFLDEAVVTSRRDPDTGRLTFVDAELDHVDGVEGLFEPFAVVVSPDGKTVYAGDPTTARLFVFRREPDTGELQFVESHLGRPDVPRGPTPTPTGEEVPGIGSFRSIAVSSDNRHVYVSTGAMFARDTETGELQFIDVFGLSSDEIVLSPDGRHAYSAFGDLVVASRDEETGQLTMQGSVPAPECCIAAVTVSGDGKNVYAAGTGLLIYARNAEGGDLTLQDTLLEGQLLNYVVASADGRFVFTAGPDENVAVFARSATDGALTLLELQNESLEFFVQSLEVSPDSRHVYVPQLPGIAVFELTE